MPTSTTHDTIRALAQGTLLCLSAYAVWSLISRWWASAVTRANAQPALSTEPADLPLYPGDSPLQTAMRRFLAADAPQVAHITTGELLDAVGLPHSWQSPDDHGQAEDLLERMGWTLRIRYSNTGRHTRSESWLRPEPATQAQPSHVASHAATQGDHP